MSVKEGELWSLHQAVLKLESLIANNGAGGGPGVDALKKILASTADHIDLLQTEQRSEETKKEETARDLAIAYMVERETALNAEEKRQYGEFLKKEYFTKDDFGNLESFYTNSYDKLTDGGKAEMSTRVWEGVRKKEYEFIELPEIVKEKEAQSLHEVFSSKKKLPSELLRIPEKDRSDFVREWDAGDKEASYQVLNRKTFADNVSLSTRKIKGEDKTVTVKAEALEVAESVATKTDAHPKTTDLTFGDLDLDLNLSDVTLIGGEGGPVNVPLGGSKGSGNAKGG